MNVAYINPFIAATRTVFDTMVHVPFMLSKPRLAPAEPTHYNVAATIELAGPAAGCIHLCMPDIVAIALAKGFAGTEFDAVNPDCLDALGEIINMIAGDARKNLPVRDVTVSVPSVRQQAHIKHEGATIIIPCDTGSGRFCIEVALHKTPAVEQPVAASSESSASTKTPADGVDSEASATRETPAQDSSAKDVPAATQSAAKESDATSKSAKQSPVQAKGSSAASKEAVSTK